jgi:hypothetical protein
MELAGDRNLFRSVAKMAKVWTPGAYEEDLEEGNYNQTSKKGTIVIQYSQCQPHCPLVLTTHYFPCCQWQSVAPPSSSWDSLVQRKPLLQALHTFKWDEGTGNVPTNTLGCDLPAVAMFCSPKHDALLIYEGCIVPRVTAEHLLNIPMRLQVSAVHPDVGAQDSFRLHRCLLDFLFSGVSKSNIIEKHAEIL